MIRRVHLDGEYELVMALPDEHQGRKARGELLAAAEDDAEPVNGDDTQCCVRSCVGSRVKSYQIRGERDCGRKRKVGAVSRAGGFTAPLQIPLLSREVYGRILGVAIGLSPYLYGATLLDMALLGQSADPAVPYHHDDKVNDSTCARSRTPPLGFRSESRDREVK